jgi:hypothetical protein
LHYTGMIQYVSLLLTLFDTAMVFSKAKVSSYGGPQRRTEKRAR